MSTSTQKRRLLDDVLMALDDLTQARPHMRRTARFSPIEYRAYCEGYYWGVTAAMQSAIAAADRFELRQRSHRMTARRKRIA